MEFGLANGLAARVPYGDMINDLRYNEQAKERAKENQANRAKLFADDVRYNNAMNSFDHQQVTNYVQPKIAELGKWQRDNPNWRFDPMKMAEYQNKLIDMKDNEHLQRGMRVDNHIKKYQDWLSDPKNADVKDLPEAQQYKQHLANYLTTGSIDGNGANRQEFRFEAPFEGTDTTPVWMNYAKNVRQNGVDIKYLADGAASHHQYVTDADKLLAAQAPLNDAKFGRIARKEYNDYVAKLPDGSKKPTLEQYAISKMNPYFDTDKYQNFSYKTGEGGRGGKGKGEARDPYAELYRRAASKPTMEVQVAPSGMKEAILGKNISLNTNGSFIRTSKGNLIPFAGGNIPDDNISTSNSRMVYNPNQGAFGSYSIQMPLSQLEQSLGGANIFDTPTFGTGWLGNGTAVRDKYQDYGIQLVKDKDGNDYAQVDLWRPMEGTNSNTHAAYNHGLGGKAEDFTSGDNAVEQPATVVQGGVAYHWNASKGVYE